MSDDKSLKGKAISIRGREYVLVSDRVLYFNEQYPNGCIQTEKLIGEDNRVEFRAIVIPDTTRPERFFTGHSQAVWGEGMVNKMAALENAETSAVGRALAFMGIGVIDSIASVDELDKAVDPDLEKRPVCSIDQKEGIKARDRNGKVFWTCPDWKIHKDKGEKFEMIFPNSEKDEKEQNFAESLPNK